MIEHEFLTESYSVIIRKDLVSRWDPLNKETVQVVVYNETEIKLNQPSYLPTWLTENVEVTNDVQLADNVSANNRAPKITWLRPYWRNTPNNYT